MFDLNAGVCQLSVLLFVVYKQFSAAMDSACCCRVQATVVVVVTQVACSKSLVYIQPVSDL